MTTSKNNPTCTTKQTIGDRSRKHGRYLHPLYAVWLGMYQRCYTKTHPKYHCYGGRGIRICKRWRNIENFIDDIMPRPSRTTLDRKNNDGNYSCGKCKDCLENGWDANCRWATSREQADNKGAYHILTFNGKSQAVYKWADELHIKYSTLLSRILCYGWSVEKALSTPVAKRVKRA